jgi:hypothetical protein
MISTLSSETATVGAALIAAIIAGGFSVSNLLVSKDQKISEFRHKWITELRKDLALFIAYASQLFSHIAEADLTDPQGVHQTSDTFINLNQAQTRIRLRLNRVKPLQLAVLTDIQEIENLLKAKGGFANVGESNIAFHKLTNLLEDHSQTLISHEWRRVKRGEWIYQAAKWITVVGFAIASALFISLLVSRVILHRSPAAPQNVQPRTEAAPSLENSGPSSTPPPPSTP